MRQGSLLELRGDQLHVGFDKLFNKHYDFLNLEENRFLIEQSLEKELEFPFKIQFLKLAEKTVKKEEQRSSRYEDEEQDFSQYNKDPKVMLLQNILKAKIRSVFSEQSTPKYHLGKSCNFNQP